MVQIEFGDLMYTLFVSCFHVRHILMPVAVVESWPLWRSECIDCVLGPKKVVVVERQSFAEVECYAI